MGSITVKALPILWLAGQRKIIVNRMPREWNPAGQVYVE